MASFRRSFCAAAAADEQNSKATSFSFMSSSLWWRQCVCSSTQEVVVAHHVKASTFSSVGRRSMQPEVGLRKKYYSARIARPSHHGGNYGEQRGSIHDLIEPLILPPTKVEEKRQKLHKMYERREKKRIEARLLEAKRSEADMGNVDGAPKFSTDYEKNKFNNGESHINLPTCSSYTTSTSRSLPPSATKRGTNND